MSNASQRPTGTAGRKPRRTLFKEYNYEGSQYYDPTITPIHSMEEWHQTFLRLKDPTEIKAALELAGSWKEWLLWKRDWPAFADMVEEWKNELNEVLKADAFQKIQKLMECKSTSTALAAARYIANNDFGKRPTGRPSKEAERLATEEIVRKKLETQDDWQRIQDMVTPVTTEEVN